MFKHPLYLLIAILYLSLIAMQSVQAGTTSDNTTELIQKNASVKYWRDLEPSNDFPNSEGLQFFRFKTDNGSAGCLVVLNLKDNKYFLKPFFNASPRTTSEAAQANNALVAVNGGYFNLSNGESTSYIVIDGKQQCDPRTNKALVENPHLKPYLETIFHRSEVTFNRSLRGPQSGQTSVQFDNHSTKHQTRAISDCEVSSLQAGPRLLPQLKDTEEAFVRTEGDGKVVDAIGSHKTAARTAFGTTADGYAMLLCIASKGQDEFSSGVTLAQLADILKQLGCSEAINFDGGTSTTMVIRKPSQDNRIGSADENPVYNYTQVCGRIPEKLVKSGLMILNTN